MNRIETGNHFSIDQMKEQYFGQNVSVETKKPEVNFREILKKTAGLDDTKSSEVHFSKHASLRLKQRNIELTDNQMERLSEGTKMAEEKGIRDSLICVDELAFIVNVPNRTVVTAMERGRTEDAVFTNIDGAVIM